MRSDALTVMETASSRFARWRKTDWTKGDGTLMREVEAWKELSDLDLQLDVTYVRCLAYRLEHKRDFLLFIFLVF